MSSPAGGNMRAKVNGAGYHLLSVIGLALAAVAGLLWWLERHSPRVLAFSSIDPSISSAQPGDIGVAWTSFTPTSTTVAKGIQATWAIIEHGVLITFHFESLSGDTVFTFTPQVDSEPGPTASSSYFFQLEGTYVLGGGPAGLSDDIDVDVQYDEGMLNGAKENTLQYYHYDAFYRRWEGQPGTVDVIGNVIRFSTNEMGEFALGGHRNIVYVPLVVGS